MLRKKTHFRWNEWEIRESKSEMTSYSDNAYDVIIFFVLKSSWHILYSFQVSLQMTELTGGLPHPI